MEQVLNADFDDSKVFAVPRKITAVYFLMLNGEVIYVGKTENLVCRYWSHRCDKQFDEMRFIECDRGDLTELEDIMQLRLRPRLHTAATFEQADRRMKMRREVLHVE